MNLTTNYTESSFTCTLGCVEKPNTHIKQTLKLHFSGALVSVARQIVNLSQHLDYLQRLFL